MKMRELVSCKVTLATKQKDRESGFGNLERNTALREAIDECLKTGKEVFKAKPGGMLYHVRPDFPLIESAMEQPENRNMLQVSVVAYMTSLHLGVEG